MWRHYLHKLAADGVAYQPLKVSRKKLSILHRQPSVVHCRRTFGSVGGNVSLGWKYSNYLNSTIVACPRIFMFSLIATDIGSIVLMYGAIKYSGVAIAADFALAFLLSRPFKRLRLPIELGLAAVLARSFPWLSAVRISDMLRSLSPTTVDHTDSNSFVMRALHKGATTLDKYGLAYQISARLTGLGVVAAIYGCLRAGVDVQQFIESFGYSTDQGQAAGAYAAAVVSASALYPGSIWAAATISRVIAKYRQ